MMQNRRPKVLVLAEKANPNWVSVPLVGWQHIEAIQTFADVHLVTHVRNQADILGRGFSAQHVTFVGQGSLDRAMHKLALMAEGQGAMGGATQTAFQLPLYYRFEQAAWRLMRERIAQGEFDLVHRITPVSPVMPSLFAARLARMGVPFVVGPINGGVPWPKELQSVRRREGEWISYLREAKSFLPYYRATRRHASALLLGSAVAWREALEHAQSDRCFYMPENAIDMQRFAQTTQSYGARPLRVAFVGRLVPFKGPELALKAVAPLVRSKQVVIDFIGDGPERERLASIALSEGIEHGVRLEGWVPHAQLQERLRQSSVFLFPSMREFGGAVVMEAMALGLVPIVVDYGGPSEVVSDDTGYRVPLGDVEHIVTSMRNVVSQLCTASPEALAQMGARARQRIEQNFSIEAKASKTQRIYNWVMRHPGERPELAPPLHALRLY